MTEKILARAAEKSLVVPGDNIWVNVDVLMTHDVCGPGAFGIFKREFGEKAKVHVLSSLFMLLCFELLIAMDLEVFFYYVVASTRIQEMM